MSYNLTLIHDIRKEDFKIKVNYTQLLGDWVKPLTNYLTCEYHTNLMYMLHRKYSSLNLNQPVIPKKDIFKAYQLSQYKDTRVCIIDFQPNFTQISNSLAFGGKEIILEDYQNYKMVDLFNQIEHFQDDDFKLDRDYTLESWAKQGVLLLNFNLIPCSDVDSYKFYQLLRDTIIALSDKTGIIFCFINNKNKFFITNVDGKTNTLIQANELTYDVLEQVNTLIENSNGKEFRIRW